MTKKLSAFDRQRVSKALTKCAAATKDIESNSELAEAAYKILSEELGDNPGLFKAACQVYNSCKSIHKLAAADDSTRGNSFSILNVQEMSARLSDERDLKLRKAASAPAVFSKVNTENLTDGELQKTASAAPVEPSKLPTISKQAAAEDYPMFLIRELEDAEDFLFKSASAVHKAERERLAAVELFVSTLATEPAHIRKDAAARLYANYGSKAEPLLEVFGEMRPMQKLATADYKTKYKGTPSLPEGKLASAAKAAIDAVDMCNARTKLHAEVIEKTASMVLDHCRGYYGLGKKAAGDMLAGAVIKGTAIKEIAEMMGAASDDKDDAAKEIFNTKFINNMIAHSHRRAFMKAAMNESLAKYPLSKLVPAYNRAVSQLPVNTRLTPATANQALIESLMAKELATGAVPSKADVELISSLANSIGKYHAVDGKIGVAGGSK